MGKSNSNKYLFINPAENLLRVASELENLGHTVKKYYSRDFTVAAAPRYWLFDCINDNVKLLEYGHGELDTDIVAIKKPWFKYFYKKKLQDKFREKTPLQDLKPLNYNDYIFLTAPKFTQKLEMNDEENKDYNSFLEEGYHIVATLYDNDSKDYSFNYFKSQWQSDADVECIIKKDYFIFYTSMGRVDIYYDGNQLNCISSFSPDSNDILSLNPSFKRFKFKKLFESCYYKNYDPWVTKNNVGGYIINDYSWGGVTVRMNDIWVKNVSKVLANAKDRR